MNIMDVYMAVYHEHKQRTGHDVFTMLSPLSTRHISCDVCLYLRKGKMDMEKDERDYHESLHAAREAGEREGGQ